MRKRGVSPWLIEERTRIRTQPTPGIADGIAGDEPPLYAWRVETGLTVRKLSRLTGIDFDRIIALETAQAEPDPTELEALAEALRANPALLQSGTAGH